MKGFRIGCGGFGVQGFMVTTRAPSSSALTNDMCAELVLVLEELLGRHLHHATRENGWRRPDSSTTPAAPSGQGGMVVAFRGFHPEVGEVRPSLRVGMGMEGDPVVAVLPL